MWCPSSNDLISYGYVTGAYIGVTVQNTDADSAAMFGLPTGAYVLEVVEGGSADRAGIQVKDIIIDLGGNTVSNVTELTRALRKFQAGDTTTVTVIRSGKEITLDITLDEKPQELPEETQPAPDDGGYSSDPFSDWFSRYSVLDFRDHLFPTAHRNCAVRRPFGSWAGKNNSARNYITCRQRTLSD